MAPSTETSERLKDLEIGLSLHGFRDTETNHAQTTHTHTHRQTSFEARKTKIESIGRKKRKFIQEVFHFQYEKKSHANHGDRERWSQYQRKKISQWILFLRGMKICILIVYPALRPGFFLSINLPLGHFASFLPSDRDWCGPKKICIESIIGRKYAAVWTIGRHVGRWKKATRERESGLAAFSQPLMRPIIDISWLKNHAWGKRRKSLERHGYVRKTGKTERKKSGKSRPNYKAKQHNKRITDLRLTAAKVPFRSAAICRRHFCILNCGTLDWRGSNCIFQEPNSAKSNAKSTNLRIWHIHDSKGEKVHIILLYIHWFIRQEEEFHPGGLTNPLQCQKTWLYRFSYGILSQSNWLNRMEKWGKQVFSFQAPGNFSSSGYDARTDRE